MQIKLNDGSVLNALVVNGANRFFQNAQRDSLEFIFLKEAYPFANLEAAFADPTKTKKITLVESESQHIYENYSLRVSMALTSVVTQPETPEQPEQREERISVIMAQMSYMEKQQEELKAQLHEQQSQFDQAVVELTMLIAMGMS